jgi:hypothetical protein
VKYAPVILFAYMRVDHLRKVIESLQANEEAKETELTIYCDGAKKIEHEYAVMQVREYVDGVHGFAKINKIYRQKNFGLAKSIITGVSDALEKSEKVIVLEDDILVSKYFLKYMNDGLNLYQNALDVASIHAYTYPVTDVLPQTFFIKGADCWGWATWRRAWKVFNPNGSELLSELEKTGAGRAFDMDGSYPYLKMLKNQIAGKNDSWAIRWHASCFLKNMLTLYPNKSMAINIGMDATGEHCGATSAFSTELNINPINLTKVPLVESAPALVAFSNFFKIERSLSRRVFGRVKLLIGRCFK